MAVYSYGVKSNMHRQYHYVGLPSVKSLFQQSSHRKCVRHAEDVVHWINEVSEPASEDGTFTVTFIVDTEQQLWINERRSEHFVCAAGHDVLSAGEMTFAIEKKQVEVVEVTNQSTGYCPEPESW